MKKIGMIGAGSWGTALAIFDAEVKDTVNGDVIENTGHVDDGVSDVDTNSTKNPTPEYISLPVQKKWIGKGAPFHVSEPEKAAKQHQPVYVRYPSCHWCPNR